MPCRCHAHLDPAHHHLSPIGQGGGLICKIFAITRRHNRQRFRRGDDVAMTGSGMISMAMCDKGCCHRTQRVNIGICRRNIHAGLMNRYPAFIHMNAPATYPLANYPLAMPCSDQITYSSHRLIVRADPAVFQRPPYSQPVQMAVHSMTGSSV